MTPEADTYHSEAALIKAKVALLNMLISLILIVLTVPVTAKGAVVLLTMLILVLALVVSYVRWKFMNRRESRRRVRVVSIDDAEMFWNSRYSMSGESGEEQEKRAS
jgi:membrane protein implicated in regulation of membrane protease activity